MSNRRNFHQQCCCFMDRVEKAHLFCLYTSLKTNGASLLNEMVHEASEVSNHYPEAVWLSHAIPSGEASVGNGTSKPSLFSRSQSHISDNHSSAFLVNLQPHHPQMDTTEAARLFRLPDLHPALGDYFSQQQSYTARNGQRRSRSDCFLPFTQIHIWTKFQMQQYSTQDSRILLPSQTLQALPPSDSMPYGRGDTVLINDTDGSGDQTSLPSSDCKSFPIL